MPDYSGPGAAAGAPLQRVVLSSHALTDASAPALAALIALEEVRRIQRELVSEEELAVAKSSLIETFPRRFESASQIASVFSTDAFFDRSHDYWQLWRSEVEAVTLLR